MGEKIKRSKGLIIWGVYTVAILVASIFIGTAIGDYAKYSSWFTFFVVVGIFVVTMTATVLAGMKSVPENHEYLIEVFGEHVYTWEAGLHFIFPFGNVMNISCDVNKAEVRTEVFGGDDEAVDFTDSSAPVKAYVYYCVENSGLAFYRIRGLKGAIIERVNSVIRSYLSGMSLDEANTLKSAVIFSDDESRPSGVATTKNDKGLVEMGQLAKAIRREWGVIIKKIVISDISLPASLVDIRTKSLEAEMAKKVAGISAETKLIEVEAEKKAMIELAEGQKEAAVKISEGIADGISKLTARQLLPFQAAATFIEIDKWRRIEKSGSRVVVDASNHSSVGVGSGISLGEGLIQTSR